MTMRTLHHKGCAPKVALPRAARIAAPRTARAATVARAEKDTKESKPSGKSSKQEENVRKAVEAMKKDGVDPKVARKVLEAWKEKQGIEGGKDLRGNVTKFGVSVVALAALQLGTDIIASYCANQSAFVVGVQQFAGHGVLSILLQTLSYYFAINAGLDVFRLGTVIGGTFVMGTRADTLYQAIEELAGEQGSINIVNKVEAAVSTSKVALALNSVRKALQDEIADGPLDLGTLDTLTAYFVLQNAESEYGWTPEKAGLSQDQANEAAAAFSKFDANDDYRLEMSEFKRLCDAADFDLTDAEVKKAVEMLDKRASGYVEFDEFAAWWLERDGGGAAGSASSEASKPKSEPASVSA